jgi:hypothetical protein
MPPAQPAAPRAKNAEHLAQIVRQYSPGMNEALMTNATEQFLSIATTTPVSPTNAAVFASLFPNGVQAGAGAAARNRAPADEIESLLVLQEQSGARASPSSGGGEMDEIRSLVASALADSPTRGLSSPEREEPVPPAAPVTVAVPEKSLDALATVEDSPDVSPEADEVDASTSAGVKPAIQIHKRQSSEESTPKDDNANEGDDDASSVATSVTGAGKDVTRTGSSKSLSDKISRRERSSSRGHSSSFRERKMPLSPGDEKGGVIGSPGEGHDETESPRRASLVLRRKKTMRPDESAAGQSQKNLHTTGSRSTMTEGSESATKKFMSMGKAAMAAAAINRKASFTGYMPQMGQAGTGMQMSMAMPMQMNMNMPMQLNINAMNAMGMAMNMPMNLPMQMGQPLDMSGNTGSFGGPMMLNNPMGPIPNAPAAVMLPQPIAPPIIGSPTAARFFRRQLADFLELADDLQAMTDDLARTRTSVAHLHTQLNQLSSDQMNRVLYLLTLLTAISVPITAVQGYFGMQSPEFAFDGSLITFWAMMGGVILIIFILIWRGKYFNML